jgi:hypothetical protein
MKHGRRSIRVRPFTNISRNGRAWIVCVRRAGRHVADYFPDAVWGGKGLALVAARRFRDELLKRVEPDLRVRRRVPKGVRSETGVVGVTMERYVVGGRAYRRFVAHWSDPETGPMRKRFSVGLYGKEQARALAEEARRKGVAQSRAQLREQQVAEAERRLEAAPPMPRMVRNPLSRKGIRMPRRRGR